MGQYGCRRIDLLIDVCEASAQLRRGAITFNGKKVGIDMFKRLVPVALAASLIVPGTALAQDGMEGTWYAEGGYQHVMVDSDFVDVTMGALALTGGYEFANGIGIEAMISQGILDEEFNIEGFDVDVGLGTSYGVGLKYTYEASETVGIFGKLRYTNFELEAEGGGITVSETDSEIGFGAGITFATNDRTYLIGEVSRIAEDTIAVHVGVGMTF